MSRTTTTHIASNVLAGATDFPPLDIAFVNSTKVIKVPFTPPFSSPPIVMVAVEAATRDTVDLAAPFIAGRTPDHFLAEITVQGKTVTTYTGSALQPYLAECGGRTQIIYTTDDNALMARQSADKYGITWEAQETIAPGAAYYCAASINGNLGISYVSLPDQNLYYRQRDANNQNTWAHPHIVQTYGGQQIVSSFITMVNNKPALCYGQVGTNNQSLYNYDFYYIQAKQADGSSWSTPVLIDFLVNIEAATLIVANKKPAVFYLKMANESNFGDVIYSQAEDTHGSNWRRSVVLSTNSLYANGTIVDNMPAVTYSDGELIQYVRALDADGKSWHTPVNVTQQNHDSLCLVSVKGKPAISYTQAGQLFSVQAKDDAGLLWNQPVLIEPNVDANSNIMFAEISGEPAFVNGNQFVRSGTPQVACLTWIAAVGQV